MTPMPMTHMYGMSRTLTDSDLNRRHMPVKARIWKDPV